jgi:hypothetical protein
VSTSCKISARQPNLLKSLVTRPWERAIQCRFDEPLTVVPCPTVDTSAKQGPSLRRRYGIHLLICLPGQGRPDWPPDLAILYLVPMCHCCEISSTATGQRACTTAACLGAVDPGPFNLWHNAAAAALWAGCRGLWGGYHVSSRPSREFTGTQDHVIIYMYGSVVRGTRSNQTDAPDKRQSHSLLSHPLPH